MIAVLRRVLAGAVVGGLVVSALALVTPAVADAPNTRAVDTCVWDDQWHAVLDELDEDPRHWIVRHLPNLSGTIDDKHDPPVGIVDPAISCDLVDSVIRHEWMHLQQVRMHGTVPVWDDHREIVADCGSWLLGSEHTPYRDRAAAERGVACTGQDLVNAWALIGYAQEAGEAQ